LDPIGHGIGIPERDARLSALLERNGFTQTHSVERMLVSTSPYRAPVSREFLTLRRTTRTECRQRFPRGTREASAMSHLDIETHHLIDHRSGTEIAEMELWVSDPEAQVMAPSESILNLGSIHRRGRLTTEEQYLIGAIAPTLANRRIFTIETAVDGDRSELIQQLKGLRFDAAERGIRWEKVLS
jgi:hypothetical protein